MRALLHGGCCSQDGIMLAAMDKNPFVVMGSNFRDIDYERVWRNELDKRLRRKQTQSTGALNSSC